MTHEGNRLYAYFAVYGDFDPDEITSLVGIAPTEQWRKGDLHPRRQLERKSSHWSLRSRLRESDAIELHMRDVIAQLEGAESAFVALSNRYGGCLQLVGYFSDCYPGLHFEADLVASLARFNVAVDFDFYALWSDARDAT